MKKEIIVSKTLDELRIAIKENGILVEYYTEKESNVNIVNNIYKGKVIAINKSLKAVFVDIGLQKGAFLPFDQIQQEQFLDENFNPLPVKYKVDPLKLKKGQNILVQVIKEPISNKGARVTTNISIAGRYVVLIPNANQIGISKKIRYHNERGRLFKIAREIKLKGIGVIVRTSAEKHGFEEIDEEVKKLMFKMNRIKNEEAKRPVPSLVYAESNLIDRIARDLFSSHISKCVVDSKDMYEKLKEYLSKNEPKLSGILELNNKSDLFKQYGIDKELNTMHSMSVPLNSGGNIVIQPTEALISIDVNSGKSGAKVEHEKMILNTNLEAAKEIARQLRLRDLGGIIVIDFIDMINNDDKKKLFNEFKKYIRNDRSKPYIFEMSPLGLIEMTRKRIRDASDSTIYETCNACEGTGWMISNDTLFMEIVRWFNENSNSYKNRKIGIICNEEFEKYIQINHIGFLEGMSRKYNLIIEFIQDAHLTSDEIYIYDFSRNETCYEINRFKLNSI